VGQHRLIARMLRVWRSGSANPNSRSDEPPAVGKETLRIRTPISVASARHPREPFAIGGYEIPPECTIIVNAHGLHTDPALWPAPHAFRPERFIDAKPEPHSFLPFGGGAHRCIGAALAQLELKVVLRAMLTRFHLAPAAQELADGVRQGIVIAPRGGGRALVVGARDVRGAERRDHRERW
jgi:cytochrome P450